MTKIDLCDKAGDRQRLRLVMVLDGKFHNFLENRLALFLNSAVQQVHSTKSISFISQNLRERVNNPVTDNLRG